MSDSSPSNLVKATLLASLEKAVNLALQSDPASQQALARHAGNLIAIHTQLPGTSAWLLIVDDGIELYHSSAASADITLSASPLDWITLVLNRKKLAEMIGTRIRVEGNQTLLLQLAPIFQQLDIDWGALLAPMIGDNLAQQLDHGSRQLMGWFRETGQLLGNQLARYFHNETGLLALRRDVYEFCQDVDELTLDTEQLALRIQRLKQHFHHQHQRQEP